MSDEPFYLGGASADFGHGPDYDGFYEEERSRTKMAARNWFLRMPSVGSNITPPLVLILCLYAA